MKIADSIRRAGRSLKNAKGRTILTSLAIAVGAFTLTAALAAGTGARQYADKLVKSNVDPQSIFVAKDPSLFGGGGGPNGGLKEYSINATQYGGATLPIAAAMFVLYGKEMSYVISGALKQYAKYCGPYAIQWYAQQYAVKHSVVRFNFFGTKGNHSGTPSQEGIYKFKAGFGGVLEEQLGYFEVSFHPILLTKKNTLRSLRR